ncbi:N-acetyl-gamma-glutamyl-phosphate reductase [Cyclobacterium xiamenense]|uniref:N-acetyl-gamma-glutamyl-phosphate reductase n=1 Tax=Cyclobacterium xiamenense TaxID=1297121 RepID=A0A1H7AMZ7_9BACT|nr:N-acetyl-gamma-glutamyl-phosphate reductase [Cyclobacterium xiamenense]SEJ65237.1 N-acetyl-gamma-glutamyl-phosphate reductase [Cyclobacterium xiamenense]
MNTKTYRIGIVGASGYTGSELARILIHHPQSNLVAITSESHRGKRFSDLHGQFSGILDTVLIGADELNTGDLDVLFLALPHGVSMEFVKRWKDSGIKLIDLSGDFRLTSPTVYEEWYKKEHTFPEGFETAVYGMPELHAQAIRKASLVANPGCYPTASILSLAPLFHSGIGIDPDGAIIDAKSGITGAGVKASNTTHFSNVNDNFKAYGIGSHRHTVEIQEQLSFLVKKSVNLQFTPHLLPVDRGILATSYLRIEGGMTQQKLNALYQDFYHDQPFVRIRKQAPAIKEVRGSNYADLFPFWDSRTNRAIVIAAIDNLVKGAAGQAVHNMNLMLGVDESMGLLQVPMQP